MLLEKSPKSEQSLENLKSGQKIQQKLTVTENLIGGSRSGDRKSCPKNDKAVVGVNHYQEKNGEKKVKKVEEGPQF